LLAWYTYAIAKDTHSMGASRTVYQGVGLQPFVRVAFDSPEFAILMGEQSLYLRLAGDILHLVSTSMMCLGLCSILYIIILSISAL
jgi:hypothetical protein